MRNFLYGCCLVSTAAWKGTEPAALSNVSVTPRTLCAEVQTKHAEWAVPAG